jgi:hypothetical protein
MNESDSFSNYPVDRNWRIDIDDYDIDEDIEDTDIPVSDGSQLYMFTILGVVAIVIASIIVLTLIHVAPY